MEVHQLSWQDEDERGPGYCCLDPAVLKEGPGVSRILGAAEAQGYLLAHHRHGRSLIDLQERPCMESNSTASPHVSFTAAAGNVDAQPVFKATLPESTGQKADSSPAST